MRLFLITATAVLAVAVSLLVSGCSQTNPLATQAAQPPPPPPNYPRLSLQLKPGMSEQEVINLLGQPTGSNLSTCGQQVGQPWQCKSFVYGTFRFNSLIIQFKDSGGTWVVNSWQTLN